MIPEFRKKGKREGGRREARREEKQAIRFCTSKI